MPIVELVTPSAIKGNPIELRLQHEKCTDYAQLQVEIFDCGVLNPSSILGFGTTPRKMEDNKAAVDIDTSHLALGVYEVRLLRLHDGGESNAKPYLDLVVGRDFPRTFFEVVDSSVAARPLAFIQKDIERLEQEVEQHFLSPLDIRKDPKVLGARYTAFVFIKDILVGTRIRLDRLELIPTNDGLGVRDSHDFVNSFLRNQTSIGIVFEYGGQLDAQSRRSSPVCVVHFPAVVSDSLDAARDYCVEKTKALLLALTLSRDAAGSIFDAVIVDRSTGQSTKFTISPAYVGNLLTGQLSGESATSLEAYVNGLSADSMGAFLAELFSEARRERDPRYQYIRLWQLLELLADQAGFNAEEPLRDYEGAVMLDNGSPRLSKGSVHTVFRLLREAQLGSTDQTWKNVNVWFAFRSAVAHYGALTEFDRLSRASVKNWAQVGINTISEAHGHDQFLDSLRWTARLLLMQRLVRAASSVSQRIGA